MSIFKRLAIATLVAATAVPLAAHAGTLTTLYSFTGKADGSYPAGRLAYNGNDFYGVAVGNYQSVLGSVFKVDTITGRFKVVHTFQGGADGAKPFDVIYQAGTLFGVTQLGGGAGCVVSGITYGCGTIFSIDPKTDVETVNYSFSQNPNASPTGPGGLTFLAGTMYGTMAGGGANGDGSVFTFDTATDTFATLYSFKGGTDGLSPYGQLLYQNDVFYGTTLFGGNGVCHRLSCGTVFAIDPVTGAETIIHSFYAKKDGFWPQSNLVYHAGSLIGATQAGGSKACKRGCGVSFAVKTSTGKEKVLDAYDNRVLSPSGLTLVGGNVYETVPVGSGGNGELLEVDLKSGQQTVLYTFTGGADGSDPTAPLTYHNGAFYGTTDGGNGTIFKFVP